MKLGLKRKTDTGSKKEAKSEEVTDLQKAKEAVAEYKENRALWEESKAAFQEKYPEAVAEMNVINEMEDDVRSLINSAKALVAAAKTTVEDFVCTRSYSRAQYDPNKVLEIVMASGDKDLLFDLVSSGVIESISLGKETPKLYFDRHAEVGEMMSPAWKEKEELSPRVKVPKL